MPARRNKNRSAADDDRKTLQLCRQVERLLSLVLGDSEDDVLRDLLIISVQPAPNAGRLLVTAKPLFADRADPLEIATHLEAARGWLRCEIAASIHRRKAPDLMFRCVR